jgi:hypothetical protein
MLLKIGDPVTWTRSVAEPKERGMIGTVLAMRPSDSGNKSFNLYDVQFNAEVWTLYGTNLEVVPGGEGIPASVSARSS